MNATGGYKKSVGGLLFALTFVWAACNNNSFLGTNLLPESDDVGAFYTDTFTLVSHTIRDDSVLSGSTLNNLTGSMYDPVFGRSYAAFFTEFFLPSNDVSFGDPDTLFIDSLVLSLAYAGDYGYSNVPQSFNIYRVTEPMSPQPENGYYSNRSFTVDPLPIGRLENFVPNYSDSINVMGALLPPHLRIRLSDRLGQEFLDQSGTVNFTNDSTFKDFFKGISMAPDTVATPFGASILYFNLESTLSGLHIHYHTPTVDSLEYIIPVTSSEARTSFFHHNYTGSEVGHFLENPASAGDSLVYVQGIGGVKTRIMIPHLKNLQNAIINKAELFVTQIADEEKTDSIFNAPVQIVCVTADSTGKDLALPDNFNVFPAFGGQQIRKVTIDRVPYVEYSFSVAMQLQEIVSNKTEDRGLFLIAYQRGESADRLVLGGNNRTDNRKMTLKLIYTPID